MKSILTFKHRNKIILPSIFKEEDVRFSDDLAEYFISEFTKENDIVFDPFAGFGTTILIAEQMNRKGYGLELLQNRVTYIKNIIKNKENVIKGNALEFEKTDFPIIDFVITSPPYMSKNNHKQYPFAGYKITGDGYFQYLIDIENIFTKIKTKLKPNAYVVIEASNIINDEIITPLAFDICNRVSNVLSFKKEIIINWDNNKVGDQYGFGYDHSYCLIFKNEI